MKTYIKVKNWTSKISNANNDQNPEREGDRVGRIIYF